MDFSRVNDILHYYEPDVDLHWLRDALMEHVNSAEVLVDLSIAAVTCVFLVGCYGYRRSRQAKAKNSSHNCAQSIPSGGLEEDCSINRPRAIELFPEIALSSLADDTGLLTDDASSSSTSDASSIAQIDDNTDPLQLDISMPEKDVSDSKENGDATSLAGDGAAKVIYRKLIQDDVNARLKLLLAEKKLFAQMKQMQSLKRSLMDSSVGQLPQDSTFNKTSMAISRRKTFFDLDRIDKTFLKRSSTIESKGGEEEASKMKLVNLKESISQLIDIHIKELSSLHDSIAEKRMHTKKLETMKNEIDSLYKRAERNNKDDNKMMVDLHDKQHNANEQKEGGKSSCDNNLVNQLQSINDLKSLFKNYDNEHELSTILEKTNEDAENSLILKNDISTLQSDLKSIKKHWSCSSTPRKSPQAQPVST